MIKTLQSISHLNQHKLEGTVLIMDIDDTLIKPPSSSCLLVAEGSRMLVKKIRDWTEAIAEQRELLQECGRWFRKKILCEGDTTAQTIVELQKHGVWVLGLTSRYKWMAQDTVESLLQHGIDLTRNNPMLHHDDLDYFDGIIYTGGASKHTALDHFLSNAPVGIRHLVFCDDQMRNCEDILYGLQFHRKDSRNISLCVYHYPYATQGDKITYQGPFDEKTVDMLLEKTDIHSYDFERYGANTVLACAIRIFLNSRGTIVVDDDLVVDALHQSVVW
jgi:hypothetical protein